MEYVKSVDYWSADGRTAITLGKFDGLHLGHQRLINKVCEYEKKEGLTSVVFAFDVDPLRERMGLPMEGILSSEERRDRLAGMVDVLIECSFTEEITGIEAEDFIRDFLIGRYHAKYIVVGPDFRFGHNKRGNVEMLRQFAEEGDYEVVVLEKKQYKGRDISSTYIREEIRKGNIEAVNAMLGSPYVIKGEVAYGNQLGRKLGFPTINVYPDKRKMLPPKGVYNVRVYVDDLWFAGIGDIGVKPTVSENEKLLIECNIFGYSGNAYGKEVTIELYHFCRPEMKFSSIEELKEKIDHDIEVSKDYFKGSCLLTCEY